MLDVGRGINMSEWAQETGRLKEGMGRKASIRADWQRNVAILGG